MDLAIKAEALYLANLLILPGIAFIVLLVYYLRNRQSAPPLAVCHLNQTLSASIWAGILIIVLNAGILFFSGYDSPTTWVIVILYFTVVHASFVMLGALGLARAMAGKHYHFPLVGRSCTG
jgi:uncharacterized Tic20 family protein